MPRAIRIHEHGGPEVLRLEDVPREPLRARQVRIRQTAVGVNYIDTYDRSGLYPVSLPAGLGREAAGVVAEAGRSVRRLREGDRVAYAASAPGAYAEERVMDAARVVKLPDAVSDREAAAMMLKGLTAWFLLRRCHRVRRGEPILLHAAAGGVGLIALQWAVALGARVIAVVGSDGKAAIAREHGAAEVVVSSREDIAARVRALTKGRGVPVVYDGVGKDTFMASLDSLAPRGLMVSYGNASGAVPPIAPLELSRRGSLYLTRPTLFHYIAKPAELARGARELFEVVGGRRVRVHLGGSYPLADAADAHRDLESRKTVGSLVLTP
ncbi:MAG TPA: quinone oxidoreductase [Steroidobacteraceae bacterium]|jgi:NADPH2:quinone reductase|nr:quinone oxidoreductase [Steroidobacteraceae bacterium]